MQPELPLIYYKTCTNCHQSKPSHEFNTQSVSKDGLACYCKKCRSDIAKRTIHKRRDKSNKRSSLYYKNNKKRVKEQRRQYRQTPEYKINESLRGKFERLFKSSSDSPHPIFGLSPVFYKRSLEKKFRLGMTWENRKDWQIVFIKSVASFNLFDPEQAKLAFSPDNIIPIWRNEKKHVVLSQST